VSSCIGLQGLPASLNEHRIERCRSWVNKPLNVAESVLEPGIWTDGLMFALLALVFAHGAFLPGRE
jgi:hypothetical protein